ncbi:MAG: hypothetical protein KIT48_20100 [Pseudolabrys sp.]|nr:hypothetical protein [Pseudolabrys sp.]
MAALSDLISTLAIVTKLPEATVFAFGRFAREAGHIAQKGRGRGAAPMTSRDAANLLLAVLGTDITREAGKAIEKLRPLRGVAYPILTPSVSALLNWLQPLGWHTGKNDIYRLKANFGEFVEFLIEQSFGDDLNRALRSIPVRENMGSAVNFFLEQSGLPIEELYSEQDRKLKHPNAILIGGDVGISLRFKRASSELVAEIGYPIASRGILSIIFSDEERDQAHGDFEVETRISEFSIAALGACIQGRRLPKQAKHWGVYRQLLFPPLEARGRK